MATSIERERALAWIARQLRWERELARAARRERRGAQGRVSRVPTLI